MTVKAVILAAGLGTRMKSAVPKILHTLSGHTLIERVTASVSGIMPDEILIVTGPDTAGIAESLSGYRVTLVEQNPPLGTGDAVKTAAMHIQESPCTLLILNGDTPLITTGTLRDFLAWHESEKNELSVITFLARPPHSYGRILREGGTVKAIVEDRDADESVRGINEVNSGVYALDSSLVPMLGDIPKNEHKGEYYLTDIVALAVAADRKTGAYPAPCQEEFTGINTREDLMTAGKALRDRTVAHWICNGVTFIDTGTVFISPETEIGTDTIIYPNVHLEGATVIGSRCIVFPNVRIRDTRIGEEVTVKDSTVIESSVIDPHATVGPFAHLRPGSHIGAGARIGNFVEIKKSRIGAGTKASHLSYIGDAEIGTDANIGAGTITCNYDGKKKHGTTIGDRAFIGSDTQFVAPVTVGPGAYVGAGSTITKDVPPYALAVSRGRQVNIEGWAHRRRDSDTKGLDGPGDNPCAGS